ncbi:MAG TPA: glycosyltransferase family 2 protein [Pyrinomonadaceae bacterium]|nr:glycosyltransferase family 2 protein [Pyrinomonadaceae bacterium]
MLIFYSLALIVLLQSILSLRGGVRYLAYVRRELEAKRNFFMPFASIIVPCRGLDQGLRANLSALFEQHYPAYEIIFVADNATDSALTIAEDVRKSFTDARSRIVIAGRAHDSGQKVHNLRAAVQEIDLASEVIVFVDTDARPRADWLRSLVAPLADEGIGATTGYRWFVPVAGGSASHLRSVWNASIATALGQNGARNFCWGGSTAIRRATFERLEMLNEWRGALSDDFALTRTLQQAKLPIRFVPNCLTASHEDCTFRQLFEFTTRQLKITRVYAPHLWKIVLFSNLLFVSVFFGGLALVLTRAALDLPFQLPLALVTCIYALGMWKAFFRLRAVMLALGDAQAARRESVFAHLFFWPLTAALYLYNALAALFSRRITWRGITYELKSPTETVVISDARSRDVTDESVAKVSGEEAPNVL